MQVSQKQFKTTDPDDIDRFPSCVSMRLHCDAIESEKEGFDRLDLQLTIRFGEHTEEILGGTVTIALKRGDLKLKIEDGRVPLDDLQLTAEFEEYIEYEEAQEIGTEVKGSVSAKDVGIEAKETGKRSRKSQSKYYQVHTAGTETEPIWRFIDQTGKYLHRMLKKTTIGIVHAESNPCQIAARFTVSGVGDIYLVKASGLWPKNISRNKFAQLERFLVGLILQEKLQPHLSYVEVVYERF
ncbi:hypothetical protein Pse7367_0488 [Thalassoporum mexicanum PCC 7367]|uniref:hypothetical protein n=1 Tax=Thalassoporum mexicanum TaxID=3457544 RepID=UPI00029F82A2|nr:hypothetical protein [Pseudanabaena sp. PCC 7367]AFY68798.1 hypothetical protein Pse7367_0488 [Pseudanabaena sp. PCC 7367]